MRIGRYDSDGNLVETREMIEPAGASRPVTMPIDPPLVVEPGDVIVVADAGDMKVTRFARRGLLGRATFQI